MKFLTSATIGFCFLSATALAAPLAGNWLSEDGGTKVHLSICGPNKLCGTLVWLGHPTDRATGKPKTDKHNPDPARRGRPLIGLQVVRGLAPSGQISGGHTYKASLTVESDGVAKVEGCVLAVLCKRHTWTRTN